MVKICLLDYESHSMPDSSSSLPVWWKRPLSWGKILLALLLVGMFFLYGFVPDGKPRFQGVDITEEVFAQNAAKAPWSLLDHQGHLRQLKQFRGKVVVMFFGYTQCPDVCPTTLGEMQQVMRNLGTDAARVQTLFVTLDPERDSATLLKEYVPAFHPSFLGLYADRQHTDQIAQLFQVVAHKRAGKTPNTYTLDHSAGLYVFDTEGNLRVMINYGQGANVITHDVRLLLAEAQKN